MLLVLLACTSSPPDCGAGFGRAADGNCYALADTGTTPDGSDTDSATGPAPDSISDTETGQDSPPDTSVDSGADSGLDSGGGETGDSAPTDTGAADPCATAAGWAEYTGGLWTFTSVSSALFEIDGGGAVICDASCDAAWVDITGVSVTSDSPCTSPGALPLTMADGAQLCVSVAYDPGGASEATCTVRTSAGLVGFPVKYSG